MAKRSPILGYNHNVRYRGLIFHVQTEDSGLMNPHLFTHLFHEGVIVSTRKLVYDNGADEGAIKSLMQAQHKAVMKDLKRGHFDDKIDLYLGETPGLLPKGIVEEVGEKLEPSDLLPVEPPKPTPPPIPQTRTPTPPAPISDAARTVGGLGPAGAGKHSDLLGSAPTVTDVKLELDPPGSDLDGPTLRISEPPPLSSLAPRAGVPTPTKTGMQPAKARTKTADRGSGSAPTLSSDNRILEVDAGVEASSKMAAAVIAANRTVTDLSSLDSPDSSPEIEIQLGADDETSDAVPRRRTRDTEVSGDFPASYGGGIDATLPNDGPAFGARVHNDSIPPLPPTPDRRDRQTGDRPAVGAATLPAARPITRPPTARPIAPPTVVSRPLAQPATPDRPRSRADESDAVEVYAPPPSSVDPPAPERPGQYAQHRRSSVHAIPVDSMPTRSNSASSQPLPPGARRHSTGTIPSLAKPTSTPAAGVPTAIPAAAATQPVREGSSGRARTPTPARVPPATARTASPNSGGVVMTRPAVIVGAPAKPASTPTRVRKAREEEGRGFGQGLISEKSLDEVILAYLSEDADDK